MDHEAPSPRRQAATAFLTSLDSGRSPLTSFREAGVSKPPLNLASGQTYSGINRLLLTLAQDEGRWLTRSQAESLGYAPQENAAPANLVFWQHDREEPLLGRDGQPVTDDDGQTITRTVRRERPLLLHYAVYRDGDLRDAAGQAPAPYESTEPGLEPAARDPLERATDILANSGAVIRTGPAGEASYDPRRDALILPPREVTPDKTYLALAIRSLTEREVRLAHAETKEPMKAEELVGVSLETAIASLMTAQDLGLKHMPKPDQLAFVAWRREIDRNPDILFRAAARAEKIRERIAALERGPVMEQGQTRADDTIKKPELCGVKIYLEVPWPDKEAVKSLGATWDQAARAWCLRPGNDLRPLKDWIPAREMERVKERMIELKEERLKLAVPYKDREEAKELGAFWDEREKSWLVSVEHNRLADLTRRWLPVQTAQAPEGLEAAEREPELTSESIVLEVPFSEKEQAKAAGAGFDAESKQWRAPAGSDLNRLARWLPDREPQPEQALAAAEEFGKLLKAQGFALTGPPLLDGRIHRVELREIGQPEHSGSDKQKGSYCASMLGSRPNGWLKNHLSGQFRTWLYAGQTLTKEAQEKLAKEAKARRGSRPPRPRPQAQGPEKETVKKKRAGLGR